MKKTLIISLILVFRFLATGVASAHVRFFGLFPFSPVVVTPAPAYYPSYYAPYPYRYRAWIPGHWSWIRTQVGWERVWIRGYWR